MEDPAPPRSIEHYRQMAAQLRSLAANEPDRIVRDQLLDLAKQYDQLVARTGRVGT